MLVQVLSGGLMLGAWFMATDYTTSPVTHGGQIVYGVGCGVLPGQRRASVGCGPWAGWWCPRC